jgi:GNAT superfamily N-acetyltransferase
MPLTVERVESSRQKREYIMLPFQVNGKDPFWVPALFMDARNSLDKKRHPFHEHADVEFFLARDDSGKAVGRVCAIVNHAFVDYHGEKTGHFGFFETFRNQEAATSLLHAASDWVRARGMERIQGPFNFSTNETCGCLVEGFQTPPMIMMPHNPPWYEEMILGAGFHKEMDLLAYWAEKDVHNFDRLARVADLVRRRENVTIRPLNMKRFREDLRIVMDIYRECWCENWGFVPITAREFDGLAQEMKMMLVPSMAPVVEFNGVPVAFGVALPDANMGIARGGGKLLPTILALKVPPFKVKIDRVRVMLMGVKKEFRGRGLEALIVDSMVRESHRLGMARGEMSWVLENNTPMRAILEKEINADVYKRYRIFQKEF